MNTLKNKPEQKNKAGQPVKTDAKKHKLFRLHPSVIEIIKKQPNQNVFIEKLVLDFMKIKK